MIDKIINGLDRFNTATTTVAGYLATALLMIMTGVVTLHVITRYCFDYSFVWTEETARYLMVWMTFLFFPTGHKKGMNVAVEFLVSSWANTKAGLVLRLAVEIALIVLLAMAVKLSFGMIARGEHTLSQALQIPMMWIYMVLPFCFVLTTLCSAENVLRLLRSLAFGVVPVAETPVEVRCE